MMFCHSEMPRAEPRLRKSKPSISSIVGMLSEREKISRVNCLFLSLSRAAISVSTVSASRMVYPALTMAAFMAVMVADSGL